jgi:hypothetical protein
MKKIEGGTAFDDFTNAKFSKTVFPVLHLLHDSTLAPTGNFVSTGNFYSNYIGHTPQVAFDYKYYLKSDTMLVILTYSLGDSVRFVHFDMKEQQTHSKK